MKISRIFSRIQNGKSEYSKICIFRSELVSLAKLFIKRYTKHNNYRFIIKLVNTKSLNYQNGCVFNKYFNLFKGTIKDIFYASVSNGVKSGNGEKYF